MIRGFVNWLVGAVGYPQGCTGTLSSSNLFVSATSLCVLDRDAVHNPRAVGHNWTEYGSSFPNELLLTLAVTITGWSVVDGE